MKETTFKFIHDNAEGNINKSNTININIEPDSNDPTKNYINSLTVTISDYFNRDLTQLLQQIETIELTLTYYDGTKVTSNNSEKIKLEITSKEKRKGFSGNRPYFYFKVKPKLIDSISFIGPEYKFTPNNYSPALESIERPNLSSTAFTPIISDIKFLTSDYNPVISNALDSRDSSFLQVADRNQLTNNPTNIDSLFAGTAPAAQIPDSHYTDTGLINSKYEGSKTSAESFGGITPAFTGQTFTGEVFSSGSNTEYICSLDNRLNQELFHTSNITVPTFKLSDVKVTLGAEFDEQSTAFTYSSIVSGSLGIGDVLKAPDPSLEYMKVESIETNINRITVVRDVYNNYPILTLPTYSTDDIFTKVARFDIFKFGTGQNSVQLINNSRIYIQGSNTVIDTDDYGQVVSESICPAPGFLVS